MSRTDDGGQTWVQVGEVPAMQVVSDGTLDVTGDAGVTWTAYRTPAIIDMTFVDDREGRAVANPTRQVGARAPPPDDRRRSDMDDRPDAAGPDPDVHPSPR